MEELLWSSRSLNNIPIREEILKILRASLAAVDPYMAVRKALQVEGQVFILFRENIFPG